MKDTSLFGARLSGRLKKLRHRKAGSRLRQVMNLTVQQAELLAETNKAAKASPAATSFHFSLLRRLDRLPQGTTPQHEEAFAQVIILIKRSQANRNK